MKQLVLNVSRSIIFLLILTNGELTAQNISIKADGSAPDGSAMLDVNSTTRGLLIPRMTFAERNAIAFPANSLLIYQTDNTPGYYFNSGIPGNPFWAQLSTPADNLGNHIATTNIQLGSNYLSGDGDNEGIYVSNIGRVGIGTTAPTRRFHIHDTVSTSAFAQFTTGVTGQGPLEGLVMGYADAVGGVFFNGENSNLAFGTNGGYRMWLNPNGDLGIGTSAPLARLHLRGPGLVSSVIEGSNSSGTWSVLQNSSVGGKYHQIISSGSANGEGAGKLLFGYGGSANAVSGIAMTIQDRLVGIGTSYPEGMLSLNSSNNPGVPGIFLDGYGATEGAIAVDSGENMYFGEWDGTTYTQNVVITNTGRLGVGTTAPTALVSVRGTTGGITEGYNIQNATNDDWYLYQDNLLGFRIRDDAADRVTINAAGLVGIGTTAPTFELHVIGNAFFSGVAFASVHAPSDKRFKTNIEALSTVLPKLNKIKGIYHNWDIESFPEMGFTDEKEIGVIAQDVQKVFPELVEEMPNGYLSVDYAKLSAVLLEAIKEQQELINRLTERTEKLEVQFKELKSDE